MLNKKNIRFVSIYNFDFTFLNILYRRHLLSEIICILFSTFRGNIGPFFVCYKIFFETTCFSSSNLLL